MDTTEVLAEASYVSLQVTFTVKPLVPDSSKEPDLPTAIN
jgi:hypothetical protein